MEVEKVSYQIDWQKFKPGASFFIPCLDSKAAKRTISRTLTRLKYKFVIKVVIEDGVRGVRAWRV
jgi:hypothetical protein